MKANMKILCVAHNPPVIGEPAICICWAQANLPNRPSYVNVSKFLGTQTDIFWLELAEI